MTILVLGTDFKKINNNVTLVLAIAIDVLLTI